MIEKPATDERPYEVITPKRSMGVVTNRGKWPLALLTIPGSLAYRAVMPNVRRQRRRRAKRMSGSAIVVSVGNLETGGNGKTPLAIHIIDELAKAGYRPVYVSRGYMGAAERLPVVTVLPPTRTANCPPLPPGVRFVRTRDRSLSRVVGDEAAVVALRLPDIPLVISRHRESAVRIAIDLFQPTHVVLDDAFQTWNTFRDIDVVMIDPDLPRHPGRLLPAGNMREETRALRRADAVGLNGYESDFELRTAANWVERNAGRRLPVFAMKRKIELLDGRASVTESAMPEGPSASLSSVARPLGFERALIESGVDLRLAIRYPDHHAYKAGDMATIKRLLHDRNLTHVVTTEKDWVKLGDDVMADIDLLVARLHVSTRGDDWMTQIKEPQAAPTALYEELNRSSDGTD